MREEDKIWKSIMKTFFETQDKEINFRHTGNCYVIAINNPNCSEYEIYSGTSWKDVFIQSHFYKKILVEALIDPFGCWTNNFSNVQCETIIEEAEYFSEIYTK